MDSFAGSYAIESLTYDPEGAARTLIRAVDERGGAVAAIEEAFQKVEIERSAYEVGHQIDAGERTLVGGNRFVLEEEDAYVPLQLYPDYRLSSVSGLPGCDGNGISPAVEWALSDLRKAVEGEGQCCLPHEDRTCRFRWTDEISAALREVWVLITQRMPSKR